MFIKIVRHFKIFNVLMVQEKLRYQATDVDFIKIEILQQLNFIKAIHSNVCNFVLKFITLVSLIN